MRIHLAKQVWKRTQSANGAARIHKRGKKAYKKYRQWGRNLFTNSNELNTEIISHAH